VARCHDDVLHVQGSGCSSFCKQERLPLTSALQTRLVSCPVSTFLQVTSHKSVTKDTRHLSLVTECCAARFKFAMFAKTQTVGTSVCIQINVRISVLCLEAKTEAAQAFALCQAACAVVHQPCQVASDTKLATLIKMYCKDRDALSRITQHVCSDMLCHVVALWAAASRGSHCHHQKAETSCVSFLYAGFSLLGCRDTASGQSSLEQHVGRHRILLWQLTDISP